MMQH
jgi:endothelin-converting enzyme